jgi:pyridoxamine 5'-phosphate oxidase
VSSSADRRLDLADLSPDPIQQFAIWFDQAETEGIHLANAMALATADASGAPSIRHVLLRGFDESGFAFYTNHDSRKGRELAENHRAAVAFFWRELERQVTATGDVERVTQEESEAYFRTRPREARIGAWASHQSSPISSREELMERFARFDALYPGEEVPLPPHWGGYRLIPGSVEFWQSRAFRLHDRFLYSSRPSGGWQIERLSP